MSEKGFFSGIIKGALCAVIITLFSVLIFAFIVKFALLNTGVVKAVNQFIKIISILLGCAFFVRGNMGLVKGVILGSLTTLLTYLLFSLFGAGISFNGSFILDLIFTAIIGGISGILAVNIKK